VTLNLGCAGPHRRDRLDAAKTWTEATRTHADLAFVLGAAFQRLAVLRVAGYWNENPRLDLPLAHERQAVSNG